MNRQFVRMIHTLLVALLMLPTWVGVTHITVGARALTATNNTVTMSIGSATAVPVGGTFDVDITIETGNAPILGADAYINFPNTLLEVVSIADGNILDMFKSIPDNDAGTIFYAGGKLSNFPSGTILLATVTFRAKAEGAATLEFDTKSDVQYTSGSILDSTVSGTVTIGNPSQLASIQSISPNTGEQGQSLSVTVTGENTNFVNGTTSVSFGDGITVNSVNVSSATQAVANISLGDNAAVGTRTVTLTTGSENVSANNGFTIEEFDPGTGAIIYVEDAPLDLNVGETYRLTVKVDPRSIPVNGVYIRGRIDPNYLELVRVTRDTSVLNSQIEPVQANRATGEFEYGAGVFNNTVTDPFPILYIDVKGKASTPSAGVAVEFLENYPPTDITGPDGSVMAEAQEGIIHVTNYAIIKGSVTLQGRSTTQAQDTKVETLMVELRSSGEITQTYTFSVTTDTFAKFELPGVPAGTYDISVKGKDTLDNLHSNVTLKVGLGNVIDFGTLLEGDINNDNFVLIDDFGPLGNCYNKKVSDVPSCKEADLTEDTLVNGSDFSYFSSNFEKCGASEMASGQCTQTHLSRALPNEQMSRLSTASLSLNMTDITTEVGQLHTITFTVEPNADLVNVVNLHYQFDPNLIEVVDFSLLTDVLDVPLDTPEESELASGTILASAGIIGEAVDEPFVIATMSVKLKSATAGTAIMSLNEFPETMIAGPDGEVMANADGIKLQTPFLFLPIVQK